MDHGWGPAKTGPIRQEHQMQSFGTDRPSQGTPSLDPVRTDPAVSLPPPPAGPAHGDPSSLERVVARGRGGTLRVVVPSAVLSAILASGLTVALAGGGGSSPAAQGTSQVAVAGSSGAVISVASVTRAGTVEQVAAVASPSVVTITVSGASGFSPFQVPASGVGSGVIVSDDGLILTNAHVVEGAGSLSVAFADGTEAAATVLATDPEHDLAVVRAQATGLTAAVLDESGDVVVGQMVVAIGSPLGTFTDTVTLGIVSGLDRSIDVAEMATRSVSHLSGLIQTDAAINAGNSGGPLLDMAGHVVGIITANASDAQGVGFAVPISAAHDLLTRAAA
jgi:S1-C subfamily serine protease